jgi:hypothetical protein
VSAEQLRRLDDDALGTALAGLDLRWPDAPDPTVGILGEIGRDDRRPRVGVPRLSQPSRRRTVLLVAAALLALAAAAGAAKLVFDLGAVTVDRIPGRPTALPDTVFPGEDPSSALGAPITRAEAEAALGVPFDTPPALGEPDLFWLQEPAIDGGPDEPWVVAAWRPEPSVPAIDGSDVGAVLIRFAGDADIASKGIAAGGTTVDVLEVEGRRALWLTGPHELTIPVDGIATAFEVRGNVLVVQDDGTTLRFESAFPRERAVEMVGTILR